MVPSFYTTYEEVESTIPVTKTSIVCNPGVHQCIDINRYSKLTKLYRVTVYVLRFINNSKKKSPKLTRPLTAVELNHAQKLWIKSIQQEIYPNELSNLQSKSSRLPLVRQLQLYLNKEGIMCCGGRIHNAPLSDSTKFPYLLPKKHRLTELIIRDTHEKHFHTGTNSTVTYLRQKYWIPAARQCVRSILRHCCVQQTVWKPLQSTRSTTSSETSCTDDGAIYCHRHRLHWSIIHSITRRREEGLYYVYSHVPALELYI